MVTSIYNATRWLSYLRKSDKDLVKLSRVDLFKATGRGGQKKNKTSNAVRLTLSYLSVSESSSRSKSMNFSGALRKLRLAIALDISRFSTPDLVTGCVPLEISPFLNKASLRINPKNPIYPIFVGFFIDLYFLNKGNWKEIAEGLGVTPSQGRRFVEKNPFLKEKLRKIEEVYVSRDDNRSRFS